MTDDEKKLERQQIKEAKKERRREELKKISSMHGKAKLRYLWDYYKFLLLIAAAVIFGVSVISTMVKGAMTDMVFQAAVVSADSEADGERIKSEFEDYTGGLRKNQDMSFDLSINIRPGVMDQMAQIAQVKLSVGVSSGTLDAVLMPDDVFSYIQEEGLLLNMDDLLTQDQISEFQKTGSLAYAQEFVPDGTDEAETENNREAETEVQIHTEPVQDEHIFGIRVDDSKILKESAFYPSSRKVYFGIINNSEHIDMALKFLEFLKGEK